MHNQESDRLGTVEVLEVLIDNGYNELKCYNEKYST